MSNNIYRVINELDLEDILNKHSKSLVVIMYSSKTCRPCLMIKPLFISLSKKYNDCFFVYIDLNDFEEKTEKYTTGMGIRATPHFLFMFNNEIIAAVSGANREILVDTLDQLRNQWKNKIKENLKIVSNKEKLVESNEEIDQITKPTFDQDDEMIKNKLTLLAKLYTLGRLGYPVNINFTLLSEYEDMIYEFNTYFQKYQEDNKNNNQDTLEKEKIRQQKILQIQQLEKENKNMQAQHLLALHKMQQIKQFKEKQEKESDKNE